MFGTMVQVFGVVLRKRIIRMDQGGGVYAPIPLYHYIPEFRGCLRINTIYRWRLNSRPNRAVQQYQIDYLQVSMPNHESHTIFFFME